MMDTQGKNRVKKFSGQMEVHFDKCQSFNQVKLFLKNELLKEKNGIDVSLSESEEKEREIG